MVVEQDRAAFMSSRKIFAVIDAVMGKMIRMFPDQGKFCRAIAIAHFEARKVMFHIFPQQNFHLLALKPAAKIFAGTPTDIGDFSEHGFPIFEVEFRERRRSR